MKIISKNKAKQIFKPEGSNVWYYLFPEYEFHYNEIAPGTVHAWHHHKKIWETVYVIRGQLTIKWRKGGKFKKKIVRDGDLIEMENTPHQLINHVKKMAKVICIKQVLSGRNKRNILRKDKVIDNYV